MRLPEKCSRPSEGIVALLSTSGHPDVTVELVFGEQDSIFNKDATSYLCAPMN